MDARLDALVDDVAALIDTDPERAAALLDGVPDDQRDGRTRALASRTALLRGDDATCIAMARAALDDVQLDSHHRALAATSLAAAVLDETGDVDAVIELLQRAIRRITPEDVDQVAGRLAQLHLFRLDLPAMEQLHAQVPPSTRSRAGDLRMASTHCLLLAFAGRSNDAAARANDLLAVAIESPTAAPWETVEALSAVATVRVLAGAHAAATTIADGFAVLDDRLGPIAAMVRGSVALELGDLDDAITALGASLTPEVVRTGLLRHHVGAALLAAAHGLRGERAAADAAIERIPHRFRQGLPILAGHVARADAIRHALHGLPAPAVRGVTQHAAWAMARGMDTEALRSLHLALRLGAPWNQLSVVERLRVDGPVDDALVTHLLAWGGRRLDATEDAARRFDALGLRLLAAEAWAQVAVLAHASGDGATEAAAIATSRAGIAACGAAGSPTISWLPAAVRPG